jgi:hypothetical protein
MARSLEGLLVLNLLFLLAGTLLLWWIRGWRTWGDVLALAGLAYVLGLATVAVVATLLLVAGGGLSTDAVVALVCGIAGAGAVGGAVGRRPLPARPRLRRPEAGELVALVPTALAATVLVELYRVARISPLTSWDAWAFWIPKAKAIYFFGGLDEQLFRSLAGPNYPILLPALNAMDFRFMGSTDATTLTVQYVLLFAGFLAAAAALLRRLAHPALVWLFLLIATVVPDLDRRLLDRIGDWPLDIFFVLATLALARWLMTRERWSLVVYGVMLAAAFATKREGQLLGACLVVGAIVAAGWARRRDWAWIAGVAACAYVVNVPWRIWWTSRHLSSDTPIGGILHGTAQFDRILPSLKLVLELLFDSGLFLPVAAVAVAAAAIALTRRDRTAAVLFAVTFTLGIVGFAWVNWSDAHVVITTNPGLNPTRRAVGSLVLLSIAMSPLLLAGALRREASAPAGQRRLANTTGNASASATKP